MKKDTPVSREELANIISNIASALANSTVQSAEELRRELQLVRETMDRHSLAVDRYLHTLNTMIERGVVPPKITPVPRSPYTAFGTNK